MKEVTFKCNFAISYVQQMTLLIYLYKYVQCDQFCIPGYLESTAKTV